MPSLGAESKKHLKGVDSRLVAIINEAIKIIDFTVLDGVRTIEEQRILFARGKTKTMNSKHLDGLAVDLAPWPVNWADTEMFCVLAGVMRAVAFKQGKELRWGGDWDRDDQTKDERFRDYGHFELRV